MRATGSDFNSLTASYPRPGTRKALMKSRKWNLVTERGDFLPIMVGIILLGYSIPTILLILLRADPGSSALSTPLLILFIAGTLIGLTFIVWGLRVCTTPGSFWYRLVYWRFFGR
jgi:hypothetical protein